MDQEKRGSGVSEQVNKFNSRPPLRPKTHTVCLFYMICILKFLFIFNNLPISPTESTVLLNKCSSEITTLEITFLGLMFN